MATPSELIDWQVRHLDIYLFYVRGTHKLRNVGNNRPHLKANSHRHARHDTDKTVLSRLVSRCELSRPDSQTMRSVSDLCRSVSDGAVRPPGALVGPTQFTPPVRDKTVAPACRPPPPRRRPGRQLHLAARPPTGRDVVRHAKRIHAVDRCT